MPRAIRFTRPGGPEVLEWVEVDLPAPGPGEVRVRHTAVGLNFIDTYHRSGLYPLPLPSGLGQEAAGEVVEVGEGVTAFRPGDQVAYGTGAPGACSEERNVPAAVLVPRPEGVSDRQAAAMMLKGMTAEYLLRRTHAVQASEAILFHAAAGGVGSIACQWAKALGAKVIGTVGSRAKAELAKAHGVDHVIVLEEEDFVARTRELTAGRGVDVVYDSVGKDTFMRSLDCLRPRGLMVSFGQSSGKPPPLDVVTLSLKGSLYLTRPGLPTYTATRDELLASAQALFEVVQSGKVRVEINQTYPLAETARAHRDLEARKTTGSTVLLP